MWEYTTSYILPAPAVRWAPQETGGGVSGPGSAPGSGWQREGRRGRRDTLSRGCGCSRGPNRYGLPREGGS